MSLKDDKELFFTHVTALTQMYNNYKHNYAYYLHHEIRVAFKTK